MKSGYGAGQVISYYQVNLQSTGGTHSFFLPAPPIFSSIELFI